MQFVSTTFHANSLATRRNITHYAKVAWTRSYDPSIAFAVVGQSTVNGPDIIKGDSSQFITEADKFYYFNESDYAVQIEYERFIDEPLGGLSMAMGDLVLDNTSKRFTYGYDGTIGTFIIPQRVVRLGIGFENTTLPVFEGVSKEVKENRSRRELYLHCRDYIDTFMGYSMDSQMYVNNRSDEIIEAILLAVGFNPEQYVLDIGLNTVGFAWFDAGTKAADAIKEICEAEEGNFYQDETGILRFENREHYTWDPHLGIQITLTTEDIIEMEYDYSSVVNRCTVYANPREVQDEQVVWSQDSAIEIPANDQITVWAEYKYFPTGENNPCSSAVEPVEGSDFTTNTLSSGMGDDMSAYVDLIEFYAFAESAKMVFRNTNPTWSAYFTKLQVRGTPAIVTNTIKEVYEDSASVLLYGQQNLEIDNNYIDDADYAHFLTRRIVEKYANPLKRVVIKIKGIPHLQLKDKIAVTDSDTDETKVYRLMKIRAVMNESEGFIQELTLREITDTESVESPHRIISAKARIT